MLRSRVGSSMHIRCYTSFGELSVISNLLAISAVLIRPISKVHA
jgi:hypothetical protein